MPGETKATRKMYQTVNADYWKKLDQMAERGEIQKRVYELPTDLDHLFDGIEDLQTGSRYIGHLRKGEWYAEFGGPRTEYTAYGATEVVADGDSLVDGRFTLYGPDLGELGEETSIPIVEHTYLWGTELTPAHTSYLERSGMGAGQEGWMGTGARAVLWSRVGKAVIHKYKVDGWKRVVQLQTAMKRVSVPLVEKIEVRYVVGTPDEAGRKLITPLREETKKMWDSVDAMYEDIQDDDVDMFYACTICQSVAPNHCCVVAPSVIPYCGILSYTGAKVIYDTDPTGYIWAMPKGKELHKALGEYEGVNETVWDKSHNTVKRTFIRSSIMYTTTNCGCFEAMSFYIPEVDGVGLSNRAYFGVLPVGVPFSKLAGIISGGAQNHGFKGISISGIKKKNFLEGDGGWNRIVWMPKKLKQEVADGIPEELYDKICTEEDALDPQGIKDFLRKKEHPVIEFFWKDGEPDPLEIPAPGEDWPEDLEREAIERYARQTEKIQTRGKKK